MHFMKQSLVPGESVHRDFQNEWIHCIILHNNFPLGRSGPCKELHYACHLTLSTKSVEGLV